MATTVIDSGRRVFTNLKALEFTPWTDDSTLGETTYDLVNIVGDTTTNEQGDNEVTSIAHEFKSEPLYENVQLGQRSFSTECIDFQNDVLKAMYGWDTAEDGTAYAPTAYKDLYCQIVMKFNSTDAIVLLPKVKMNSKVALASMNTDVSRGTISGTCYSAFVKSGTKVGETDMAVIPAANVATFKVAATSAALAGA